MQSPLPSAPSAKSLSSFSAPQRPQRFTFIDGLRGIAAMAVVFYHLVYNTELTGAIGSVLPAALREIAFRGSLGVNVFFVISGFVIAYSLRSTPMTGGEIGNFIVRRQLRLDPPYWCVLVIVVIQSAVGRLIPSPMEHPLPTAGEIALSAAYLQKIAGSRELLGVAWTLCIEIQFYLSFVVLLWLASIGRTSRRPDLVVACILAALTGIASAFIRPEFWWFVPFWHYFTAGALCVWAVHSAKRLPTALLVVQSLAIAIVVPLRGDAYATAITGLATVWMIYGLGRAGLLTSALRQWPFQYLGRISYSLYLVHLPVLMVVMQTGQKITGTRPGFAIGWMLLACVASIAAADVVHRVIERPSMEFASRFKRHRLAVQQGTNAVLAPFDPQPRSAHTSAVLD